MNRTEFQNLPEDFTCKTCKDGTYSSDGCGKNCIRLKYINGKKIKT